MPTKKQAIQIFTNVLQTIVLPFFCILFEQLIISIILFKSLVLLMYHNRNFLAEKTMYLQFISPNLDIHTSGCLNQDHNCCADLQKSTERKSSSTKVYNSINFLIEQTKTVLVKGISIKSPNDINLSILEF